MQRTPRLSGVEVGQAAQQQPGLGTILRLTADAVPNQDRPQRNPSISLPPTPMGEKPTSELRRLKAANPYISFAPFSAPRRTPPPMLAFLGKAPAPSS